MQRIEIEDAKTILFELIDRAHSGETIMLTKDGKPWALLTPLNNLSETQN